MGDSRRGAAVAAVSFLFLPLSSPFTPPMGGLPLARQHARSASLLRAASTWSVPKRSCACRAACTHSGDAPSARSGGGVFKLFYNDIYEFPLPDKHRFPMGKYRIVRERIQDDPQAQVNIELEPSPLVKQRDLRGTHCSEYIKRFLCNMLTEQENRNIGFPWSPDGVKRALSSVGGTVAAAHAVCRGPHVFSGHVAGGTHHAFYDHGEGSLSLFLAGCSASSDASLAANTLLLTFCAFPSTTPSSSILTRREGGGRKGGAGLFAIQIAEEEL